MTTAIKTAAIANTNVLSIAFVAFMGLTILFAAGFANSATIHDSAHDTRHATGFACH